MTPERRQRIRDELVLAFTTLANRMADVLDEVNAASDETPRGELTRRRRAPQRRPYVPAPEQQPSAEANEIARAAARRAGVRLP